MADDRGLKFKAAFNLGKKFYPLKYTNSTDNSEEWLCVAKEDWGYTDESCLHSNVVPSIEYQQSVAQSTDGQY